MNRQFKAPRPYALWVSDFTYGATWSGLVSVAFVADAYARRIVGWRGGCHGPRMPASCSTPSSEPFINGARSLTVGSCITRIADPNRSRSATRKLAEAGVEPSVGSVGDSYDNALAETINDLFNTEVIHRRGLWRFFEAVEFATLE